MLANAKTRTFLELLSNAVRWQLLTHLAKSDFSVTELQKKVKAPQNLISYHLGKLRRSKLVLDNQSIADGRETYYSLNMNLMHSLLFSLGEQLHPALSPNADKKQTAESTKKVRVLFLCTHNSARSQIAEGLLRAKAKNAEVFSAGTEVTRVNPYAIAAMDRLGIDISKQHSKSLEEFRSQKFDYVITVCDRAKESCPIFPGAPEQIHWSIPDPSEVKGSDEDKHRAFDRTAAELNQRIGYLTMMFNR
jgi:protein-tyrosine-phosphatase/DNA-binding transcriptional ArsR family regulator